MSTTKYTKEILEAAVQNSESYAGVLRHLGLKQAGGTQHHIITVVKKYEIDTSHFRGKTWNKGRTFPPKRTPDEILIVLPDGSPRPRRQTLLRAMLEMGLTYECSGCYNDGTWEGTPLTLEIDHIDGNWLNNLIENLRFMCPNCHSQCSSSNMPYKYRASVVELGYTQPLGGCAERYARSNRVTRTCECGREICQRAKRCKSCARSGQFKIDWPTDVELIAMLAESNYTQVGLKLGVSDNAVRKHLNKVH